MDFLTALAPEICHLLGQEHEADSVIAGTLTAGTRLMPLVDASDWLAAVDLVFSEPSLSKRGR